MKGVVLLDIHSKQIFVFINFTHHECIFPYQSNSSNVPWEYHTNISQELKPNSVSNSLPNTENTENTSRSCDFNSYSSLSSTHHPLYTNLHELSLHQLIWQNMFGIILLLGHQNLSTQVFPPILLLFIHLIIYYHHVNHFVFLSKKVLSLKLIEKHVSLNIG